MTPEPPVLPVGVKLRLRDSSGSESHAEVTDNQENSDG
jgi:hypothetical protein